MRRHGDLEIDENLSYQRNEWRFQTATRIALAVLLGLAAMGLFGDGPLSDARWVSPDRQVAVEFERFVRRGAATRIRLVCIAACGAPWTVTVANDYLDRVEIKSSFPEPSRAVSRAGATTFEFEGGGRGGTVDLVLEPRSAGLLRPRIRIGSSTPDLAQFSWY